MHLITRRFVINRMLRSLSLVASGLPFARAQAQRPAPPQGASELLILSTNDTHSRLDPFPNDGSRNAGFGGVARRATLIRRFRDRYPNVLLLDAGDIFQGTPYFNFFKGEPEIKAMTALGYDCATPGNHDFDAGVDGLAKALQFARFPLVSANLDASGSILEGAWKPWITRLFGDYKVGIFGLTVKLAGLVPSALFAGVNWSDPVTAARKSVAELEAEGCHAIICLSHLGFGDDLHEDKMLAREVPGIDLIVGGHTHRFLDEPVEVQSHTGTSVAITQQGWAGIRLGAMRATLDTSKPFRLAQHKGIPIRGAWG
ncbi:MAG: metallophosphoesterase [Opitutales bacterium]|nr:metallophosphoesterase [Opitutales bacterium]NRA27500.1 metallophosphoesterase [Opitutales bacterium]